MRKHVLEHIYTYIGHRPILKNRWESGRSLSCVMAMSFDKLGLVAPLKPVGLPAERHGCFIVITGGLHYICRAYMDRLSEDEQRSHSANSRESLIFHLIIKD